MVWFVFSERFKFTPDANRRATIVYKPSDQPRQVTRECAEKALKAGAGRRSTRPRRERNEADAPKDTETAVENEGVSGNAESAQP